MSTAASSAFLPGYEAQISESGVAHSASKLDKSADSLRDYFHSTDTCTTSESASLSSSSTPQHNVIRTSPCSTEEETLSYRCRCTFQLICITDNENKSTFAYAMRVKNEAVPINSSHFPIATPRIQLAMSAFIELVNGNRQTDFTTLLASRPASISFAASWDGTDCTATINYTDPLPDKREEEETWLSEADALRRTCKLTCLIGRSKKKKLIVVDDQDVENEIYINDTITISTIDADDNIANVTIGEAPALAKDESYYSISYKKPEDAFQHPNKNAMKDALKWMLNCISTISRELKDGASASSIGILEMYCGCGAHTVPIVKSGLIDFVVAVELDERLIKACQRNCRLNNVDAEFSNNRKYTGRVAPQSRSPTVLLFHGDAGLWAMKAQHKRHRQKNAETRSINSEKDVSNSSWYDQDYSILLVDPPRAGLDANLCQMAIEGPFQHLIYISCGKDALLRDLKMLDCAFEAIDLTLIDLFPRTDAIESLVHLRRRAKSAK